MKWGMNTVQFLNIAAMVLRVMNLVLLILLLGHWNACLQFFVPMLRDFPERSWVAIEEIQVRLACLTCTSTDCECYGVTNLSIILVLVWARICMDSVKTLSRPKGIKLASSFGQVLRRLVNKLNKHYEIYEIVVYKLTCNSYAYIYMYSYV